MNEDEDKIRITADDLEGVNVETPWPGVSAPANVAAGSGSGSGPRQWGTVTGVAPADESAEALTSALHDLLKDPARLAWMGRHAAQWTRQAFAPERYAQLAVRRLL